MQHALQRDVVFEEGSPHRMSPVVGEQIPLFNTLSEKDIATKDLTTINESTTRSPVLDQSTSLSEPDNHEVLVDVHIIAPTLPH